MKGLDFASHNDKLVTLGIKPNRPDTGYGYIQVDEEKEGDFYKVKTFIEKPAREFAEIFIQSDEFYWNSGIFVWHVNTILKAFHEIMPDICPRVECDSPDFTSCPNISIDYSIMEKADNEMYALVDEEFLAKFSNQHLNYMKKLYYSFYAGYCKRIKRKPLTSEDFFKNMHLRRFQLYQLCCPYCGTVSLCIHDKKESKTAGYNFCHSCGRTSTLKNIQKHLARFVRIKRMNRISIQAVAEHRPETEKWLLAYDCYQIEIIELASIIEVLFRDYFDALLFISCESKKDSFLEKIVRKYTGNDFMNIEKTNDIYKKAFGIEIRKNLNAETWDDLLDIVNLRNMIVHNNGQVDKRFESTSTFRRWKDRVDIPLIKIEDEDIAKLLSSVIDAVTIISNLYLKEYYQRRNRVIANYYFNKENAYDFFADTE